MAQTEWIISLDDDLKDYDELFVGNVRDGDRLTRCKDCKYSKPYYHGSESNLGMFTYLCTQGLYGMNPDDYCSRAKRKEE